MASVQELLLAGQAKTRARSPLLALAEGAGHGFIKSFNEAPARMKVMQELQAEQAAQERAAETDKWLRDQIAGKTEDKTKQAFDSVAAPRTPAHPGVRLASIKPGSDGYLKPEFKVEEPKALQPREYADEKGRARIGKWDPQSGLVQSPSDPYAPVAKNSETDPVKRAKDLRGEFTDLSKDYFKVNDSMARIRASAKDPSAAGDLALIFNFMKVLDPGSVVRESEFATAQNAAGVPDQIRAQYNKVLNGERLVPETRTDFVKRAEGLYESQKSVHGKRVKEYERLAREVGAEPSQVIVDQSIDSAPAEAGDIVLLGEKGARLAQLRAKKAAADKKKVAGVK